MKTLMSSAALGTLLVISLINGSKADVQSYAGSAAGSSAGSIAGTAAGTSSDGPYQRYQKRAATTTDPTPPTINPDAETLTTPPEPEEKPPKPPKFPLPPKIPFPFPGRPGFQPGAFPAFPTFQFPAQGYNPFPYYGFNPVFPYSFPFQPLPLIDFNTYNQQLQDWIKSAELQAQQAAANNKDNNPTNNPSFVGAAAQGVYGPQGGFGQTFVYPPPQDGQSVTYNRIAPPLPGGNRFGVSSFSSSSFSDNNGDKKGTKFSSVSVDDNGNVTTVVSSDPRNNVVAAAPANDANDSNV